MTQTLAPIATAWRAKITKGIEKRKPWLENARQLELFYSGASDWMWKAEHREKYQLETLAPKFHLGLSKAFEFVSLYGPSLYWQNPQRQVQPKEKLELKPSDLQFLGIQDQFAAQQVAMQMEMQKDKSALTSQLVSLWLNYTPGEQTGGGLKGHSELATNDALVKGRGCMTVEPYRYPDSKRTLTGGFYLSPYDVVIDPDAETLWSASWIAIRCVHPLWEFVKKYAQYGVTEEIAKKYAIKSSNNGKSENSKSQEEEGLRKTLGESFDSIVYWKVYSNGGVGTRLANMNEPISDLKNIDDVIGDHAFLVIPDAISDCVFNAPNEIFDSVTPPTPEDLQARFAWPIPYWKAGKWPVAFLDFYKIPGSVWPMAPLGPSVGLLTFINVVISYLPQRIISSARDFITCPKALKKEIEDLFAKGLDLSVFGVDMEFAGNKIVEFIQHPTVNSDMWRVLDEVMQAFEKSSGLSELMYGGNPGATSRTAEDASMKRQALSVRPDHMATKVEEWQTEVAEMEHICTQIFITSEDVRPVMGDVGAMFWQQLIMTRPIEDVLREVDVSIEAGSARKPNKDRDVANLSQAMQMLAPTLSQFGMETGNFDPYNALVRQWGIANDMKTDEMMIPPPPPPMPMQPPSGQQVDQNGQPIQQPPQDAQQGQPPQGGPPMPMMPQPQMQGVMQ